MSTSPSSDVTARLLAWGRGESEAREMLVPLVYVQLGWLSALGISESTVKRDWSVARAWLFRRLAPA